MTELRCAIEYRADDERRGPGRLRGVLLTYGEPRADRREVFRAGALEWPDDGIVLRRQHSRFEPVARVLPEVRGAQVVLDVALPDTRAGRDAAAEVRGGLFRGLSVEFNAQDEGRTAGGLREIRRALLVGAGLVDSPAYTGSTVEVRGRRRRIWL
ncbi:MAG: HK97 family phage prohead protease [Acidobacteria bacterium]|nr:HK97 family phage prohead protease [Acidobacteriota bacterium]